MKDITDKIPILDLKKQYRILNRRQTQNSVKLLILFNFIFTVLYFIFPLDIIPDFILGIGYFDDLSIYILFRELIYTKAENETYNIKQVVVETFKYTHLTQLLIVIILVLFTSITVGVILTKFVV